MKDKILIYQDYTMHNFGLAKTLQEKHDCDLFAIIDVTDNTNKFFQKTKKSSSMKKHGFYMII